MHHLGAMLGKFCKFCVYIIKKELTERGRYTHGRRERNLFPVSSLGHAFLQVVRRLQKSALNDTRTHDLVVIANRIHEAQPKVETADAFLIGKKRVVNSNG